MKHLFAILVIICAITGFSQEVDDSKEVFKVWGNCEMCKKKIDQAALSVKGVKSASWSVTSNKMKVKFDANLTNTEEIKKAIAEVGYDTEEFRAEDDVYNGLHHCCQYKRPEPIE